MKLVLYKLGIVLGALVFLLAMVSTAYATVSLPAGLLVLAFSALTVRICWLEFIHLEISIRRAKVLARRKVRAVSTTKPTAA